MEQHRRQHRTANRGQLRQAKDRRGSSLELFAGGAEEPLRDTESVARAATAEGGLFLLVRPDGIDRQALEAIYSDDVGSFRRPNPNEVWIRVVPHEAVGRWTRPTCARPPTRLDALTPLPHARWLSHTFARRWKKTTCTPSCG